MEHLQTHHHIEPYIQPSRQLPPMANQLPPLIMSSSNVSTSTLDSELVSPDPSQEAHFNAVNASTLKPAVRDSTSPSVTPASGSSTASPRQLVKAPVQVLNVGSKRTATGQLKQSSPTRGAPSHSRDVSKRHSAIELSADLRTRLKYAMLKVQNGWESQNIQQLEQLQVASPKTIVTDHSPSRWSERRDSTSSTSDAYYASPFSTTGHGAAHATTTRPHDTSRILQRQLQFSPQLPPMGTSQYTLPPMRTAPPPYSSLAPPAQISSSSSASASRRRPKAGSTSARFGPQLTPSSQQRARSGSNVGTPPHGIIHTKAEKDAVDSLLFMSSPVNAGRARGRASTFTAALSNGASPARHKRVDFAN